MEYNFQKAVKMFMIFDILGDTERKKIDKDSVTHLVDTY